MLGFIILKAVDIYTLLIVVYVLMSWIPNKRGFLADVDTALGKLCDPYLDLFRRIIPPVGMVDFSPIVALIALELVARLIVGVLL
ncbi:MAG: YggT family protein [Eggerthellales bacterium]|nr:YggT family protein [Eggerthellales bacterium]